MNGIFGRDQRLWVWKHMWTTSSGMPADRRFTGSPSIWPTVAVDWHGPVFGTDELPGAGSGNVSPLLAYPPAPWPMAWTCACLCRACSW